jgi:O-antigen/teichoic acid export membrane protein
MRKARLVRRIRVWLAIFIVGLVVSGVTAFPLVWETGLLVRAVGSFGIRPAAFGWVSRVHKALVVTDGRYPFLAYGTDWLAFAHLVLAIVFVGPWRDPVRNKWVIQFGLLACAGGGAAGADRWGGAGDSALVAVRGLLFWCVWSHSSVDCVKRGEAA